MATNNFKPFATAENANVTAQADWEALPALLSGFMAGKASSAQVNKAIRQASFIAAALAQYTANKSGLDVLDDGDLNGFISKMGTAFGKDFQALDATLTALAGLATGANKLPYFTGNDTAAQTDLTSVGRDIIGKNTIADILTYLGILNGLDFTGDISAPNINGSTLVTVGDGKSGLASSDVDGASFDGNNMNIKSWNGIGFQNAEDLAIRAYIDTRLGIVAATEKVTAGTAHLYKNGDIFGDIWSTGAGKATQKWLSIYLNEKFSLKNDLGTAAKKDVGTGTGQIPDMSSFTSGGDGGESYWYKRPGLMVQSSIASAPVGDSMITLPFAPPTKLNFVEVIINESSSKPDGPLGCNKLNATQFKVSNWGGVPVQFRFIAWCE